MPDWQTVYNLKSSAGQGGVRPGWVNFFTGAACEERTRTVRSGTCCDAFSLWAGILFKDKSCLYRYLLAFIIASLLLYGLIALLSNLWRWTARMLGRKKSISCDSLLKVEKNCRKLKKVLESVGSSDVLNDQAGRGKGDMKLDANVSKVEAKGFCRIRDKDRDKGSTSNCEKRVCEHQDITVGDTKLKHDHPSENDHIEHEVVTNIILPSVCQEETLDQNEQVDAPTDQTPNQHSGNANSEHPSNNRPQRQNEMSFKYRQNYEYTRQELCLDMMRSKPNCSCEPNCCCRNPCPCACCYPHLPRNLRSSGHYSRHCSDINRTGAGGHYARLGHDGYDLNRNDSREDELEYIYGGPNNVDLINQHDRDQLPGCSIQNDHLRPRESRRHSFYQVLSGDEIADEAIHNRDKGNSVNEEIKQHPDVLGTKERSRKSESGYYDETKPITLNETNIVPIKQAATNTSNVLQFNSNEEDTLPSTSDGNPNETVTRRVESPIRIMVNSRKHPVNLEHNQPTTSSDYPTQEDPELDRQNQRRSSEVRKRPRTLLMHNSKPGFLTSPADPSEYYKHNYGNHATLNNTPVVGPKVQNGGTLQRRVLTQAERMRNFGTFDQEASGSEIGNLVDNGQYHDSTGDTTDSRDVNQPDNIRPRKKTQGKQSPVDIQLEHCLPLYFDDPLVWYCYSNIPLSMNITNWNETVALSGVWHGKETPCISGGPLLDDVYLFDKLIFKWGACDHTGSEHATDGRFYPLERQMIFKRDSNSVYAMSEPRRRCNNPDCIIKHCNEIHTMTDSLTVDRCFTQCRPNMLRFSARVKGTGQRKTENNLEYVIISSFYEIFDCDPYSRNSCLDNILKFVNYVESPGATQSIPVFSLDLIQKPFNCNYFSYFGSLTFPPYSENVLWIIQPDISFVSKQQMESLREIRSERGEKVLANRRVVQPLIKRCIYLCC